MKRKILAIVLTIMLCSIVLLAVACQTESTETYSVVFRVDGSVHARVAIDDDFTLPADPEKDNYTFGGWFLDTDFTKPFSQGALSSQTFTADLDVYAKMLPKSGANSSQSNNNTGNNSGNNNGDNSGGSGGNGSGGNGSGGSGNWQQGDSSFSVSQADQMATYNDIEDYLDDWLSENAQEKGAFRSQMGGLRIDLDAKKAHGSSSTADTNRFILRLTSSGSVAKPVLTRSRLFGPIVILLSPKSLRKTPKKPRTQVGPATTAGSMMNG